MFVRVMNNRNKNPPSQTPRPTNTYVEIEMPPMIFRRVLDSVVENTTPIPGCGLVGTEKLVMLGGCVDRQAMVPVTLIVGTLVVVDDDGKKLADVVKLSWLLLYGALAKNVNPIAAARMTAISNETDTQSRHKTCSRVCRAQHPSPHDLRRFFKGGGGSSSESDCFFPL